MSKSYFLVKLRKFESAPTVMYCILSSVIQENTQELSVTIYTHYSLAIWLRSFTKWVLQNKRREEELSKQKKKKKKSSMHEFKRKFFKCSACFLENPRRSTRCAPAFENQISAVCHLSLEKININLAGTAG